MLNISLRIAYSVFLAVFLWACTAPINEDNSMDQQTQDDQYRPQFHFSPPQQWMNDPNGMVYYDGEYHLFYQHYPDSTIWGPMHWGHAISRDLIHWEHLPIALYPDSLGYIFSGSAVVDRNNTSGLGTAEQPPLVAIFTYHDPQGEREGSLTFQTQGITYSNDRGRTWTKYEGNPVLSNPGIRDFRDPKVFWYEPAQRWIMALAVADHIRFYSSPDLLSWTYTSSFGQDVGAKGGVWECPDLFPLPVDETGEERWVLLVSINPGGPNGGSATQYFVGDFNGETFTLDSGFAETLDTAGALWIDYGRDNYAGVTWSDIPKEDNRRIFLGWMSNWDYAQVVPTSEWRSAMTLPRRLGLQQTVEGLRVSSTPIEETKMLRHAGVTPPESISNGTILHQSGDGLLLEVVLTAELNETDQGSFGLSLTNAVGSHYRIGYDVGAGMYFSDRTASRQAAFSEAFAKTVHRAPVVREGNAVTLHLFIDLASAELFAEAGRIAMTDIFFPDEPFTQLQFFQTGAPADIRELKIYTLESIWNQEH